LASSSAPSEAASPQAAQAVEGRVALDRVGHRQGAHDHEVAAQLGQRARRARVVGQLGLLRGSVGARQRRWQLGAQRLDQRDREADGQDQQPGPGAGEPAQQASAAAGARGGARARHRRYSFSLASSRRTQSAIPETTR
jgi:hypothetical protein